MPPELTEALTFLVWLVNAGGCCLLFALVYGFFS